jgi:arylsulfatase A-like enzyme
MTRWTSCTVGLIFAGALVATHRSDPPKRIVIVTLDTTRADQLPPYGFSGIDLPALTDLAGESVVFDRATTAAPLTLPAHTSLFTGLYPTRHDVRDNTGKLRDGVPTLAALLRSRGFRTAAFVGSIVLNGDRGLARGFDEYRDLADLRDGRMRRPANEVVDEALAWLNTVAGDRFLLWVHLYDAHQPYAPPEPFRTRYDGQPYLAAIAFMDSQVGRLVRALDARGFARGTAMVVAADHGESLGEHGEETHGLLVYESVLHVPFILRVPGFAAGRVEAPVSLVDLVPTLLDLEGLSPVGTDGMSLRALMEGRGAPNRTLYAESQYGRRFGWSGVRAVRDGRFKLIASPHVELYDLDVDPGERHDISKGRPVLARALMSRLPSVAPIHASAPDDLVRERLASLGYVAGRSDAPSSGNPPPLPDPRDHIAEYNARMAALQERAARRY